MYLPPARYTQWTSDSPKDMRKQHFARLRYHWFLAFLMHKCTTRSHQVFTLVEHNDSFAHLQAIKTIVFRAFPGSALHTLIVSMKLGHCMKERTSIMDDVLQYMVQLPDSTDTRMYGEKVTNGVGNLTASSGHLHVASRTRRLRHRCASTIAPAKGFY